MTQDPAVAGPATDLIPLSAQFDNHDEYRPQPTGELAGRSLLLHVEGGGTVAVSFSAERLEWAADRDLGAFGGREGRDAYEAVELRPGLLLVVVARLAERVSALAIVDLERDRVLVNLTRLPADADGRVQEETRFLQAGIDGALSAPFARSAGLVGKRVHHRYSSTHAFEHIYLNATTYAYQGLEGPEAGVADVDRTDTFELADRLYLFSWHERAQPFNGAIALDLAAGRAFGRLFGWDRHTSRALQIRTGSIATLLNETSYDGL